MSTHIEAWLDDLERQAESRLAEAQQVIDAVRLLRQFHENTQPPPVPASPEQIREATISVLANYGRPTHRKDIFQTLQEMEVHIRGKDPVANLGAILSRYSTDFVPHGNGLWGLKKRAKDVPDRDSEASIEEVGPDDIPF